GSFYPRPDAPREGARTARRPPWRLPGAGFLPQAPYLVPDPVGQRLLGAARHRSAAAPGGQDDRLVVVGAEGEAVADLVDDEQVAALAGELGPAGRQHVVGLGGE